MIQSLSIFVLTFVLLAGENVIDHKQAFDAFKVCEGVWVFQSKEGEFHESWNYVNDSLFIGNGCFIQDGDTVFNEKIRVIFSNEKMYYCALDARQNGGAEVRFPLKKFTGNKWEFELKEHDFPQLIGYEKPSTDSMYAWIEGAVKEKFRKNEFSFKRISK
jgi:hypothetical protein